MKPKATIVSILLLISVSSGFSQTKQVSLEEAIATGIQNYPFAFAKQLELESIQKLTSLKTIVPSTNIFLTGEEFDFKGSSGIHSIGFQQNFNLPKLGKSQRTVYQQQAGLVESELNISLQELSYRICLSYYDLVFYKQRQVALERLAKAYEELVQINQQKFDAGQNGKLPLLTAQDQLKATRWQQATNTEAINAAGQILQNQMRSETVVDTELNAFPAPTNDVENNIDNHPLLAYYQQAGQIAASKIELQKAQLLPKLQTGLRFQTVNGQIPFWGYQLGMIVPIFKKNQKTKIEASQVQLRAQQAKKEAAKVQLETTRKNLNLQLQKQSNMLNYLRNEIIPSVEQRQIFAKAAFRSGEANYLEYMQSIEQGLNYELKYIEALRDYYYLKMQLRYLLTDIPK